MSRRVKDRLSLGALLVVSTLGLTAGAHAQTNPIQLTMTPQVASLNDETVVAVQQPGGPLSNASLAAIKTYVFSESALPAANVTGLGANVLTGLQAPANSANGFLTGAGGAAALGLESAAFQPTTAFDAAGAATTAQSNAETYAASQAAAALASAEAAGLQKTSNLSDLSSVTTARTNLGLGSAATQPATAFDSAGAAAAAQTAAETYAAAQAAAALASAEAVGLQKSNNLSDLSSVTTARTNLGLGSAATQPTTAFDAAGAATTAQTAAEAFAAISTNQTSGTLSAARLPAFTGDITTSAGSSATTLATVNGSPGSCGSATQSSVLVVNGKGLTTACTPTTITPAIGSITGLGSGVASAMAAGVNTTGGLAVSGGGFSIANTNDLSTANNTVNFNNQTPFQFNFLTTGNSLFFHGSGGGGDNLIQIVKNATNSYTWIFNNLPTVNGNALITQINGTTCTLGYAGTVTPCTVSTSGASLAAGSTATSGFSAGQLFQSNGSTLEPLSTTGTGVAVLASSPTLTGAVFVGTTLSQNSAFAVQNASGSNYGGAWYMEDTSSGATNPFKYFRIGPSGDLAIINSAYSTQIFDVTDAGLVTLTAGLDNQGYSYSNGSTNSLNCPALGDGNSPTANTCYILATTSSGNKSQFGLAVSLNTGTGVAPSSGGESVAGYFSNFGTSTSQKLWGLTSTVAVNGPNGANGEEIVLGNGYCDPGDPWNPTGCMAGATFLLMDANGTASSGQYEVGSMIEITNAEANSAIAHVGIFLGENSGTTSSITDAGIADFTRDFSIIRGGGTHTHFYYPEPTYSPVTYTSTMWDGEFTAGDSGMTGVVLAATNSAAVCNGTPSTSGFSWSCSSDARLKTDYGPDGDELAYINSLPIDRYKINATGEITVGPIAQKLQKVHPEMVHEVDDDLIPADKENAAGTMLSADQPDIWRLTRGIQQVWAHDQAQDTKIAALQTEVSALRSRRPQLRGRQQRPASLTRRKQFQ